MAIGSFEATQHYTAGWSSAAQKCEKATDVCEEHNFFTDYLIEKGVPTEQAQKDVCKMESSISAESYLALKQAVRSEIDHKSEKLLL